MASDKTLIIKVSYRGVIKKLPLREEDISYEEFLVMMQRVFKGLLTPSDPVIVKYQDEEKDWVTVSDTQDLVFAFSSNDYLVFRLEDPNSFEIDENTIRIISQNVKKLQQVVLNFADGLSQIQPTQSKLSDVSEKTTQNNSTSTPFSKPLPIHQPLDTFGPPIRDQLTYQPGIEFQQNIHSQPQQLHSQPQQPQLQPQLHCQPQMHSQSQSQPQRPCLERVGNELNQPPSNFAPPPQQSYTGYPLEQRPMQRWSPPKSQMSGQIQGRPPFNPPSQSLGGPPPSSMFMGNRPEHPPAQISSIDHPLNQQQQQQQQQPPQNIRSTFDSNSEVFGPSHNASQQYGSPIRQFSGSGQFPYNPNAPIRGLNPMGTRPPPPNLAQNQPSARPPSNYDYAQGGPPPDRFR